LLKLFVVHVVMLIVYETCMYESTKHTNP